ncbi:unnamed protein product [Angiostrongylus costaricensis]|uniref:Neur_chan_LBD domain-containing protein n=1 Tax=Angiostrongylus costaricensis TaxID=334426 RepID=A0A0R3PL85_ANGCS|nr:unnamed protein product [Angiostrongylus costaricensis]
MVDSVCFDPLSSERWRDIRRLPHHPGHSKVGIFDSWLPYGSTHTQCTEAYLLVQVDWYVNCRRKFSKLALMHFVFPTIGCSALNHLSFACFGPFLVLETWTLFIWTPSMSLISTDSFIFGMFSKVCWAFNSLTTAQVLR